jgi:hypothetical protein
MESFCMTNISNCYFAGLLLCGVIVTVHCTELVVSLSMDKVEFRTGVSERIRTLVLQSLTLAVKLPNHLRSLDGVPDNEFGL